MAGPRLTPSGNIVEVNNVPTDHQPNPRTEDVDGVGHEIPLARYLPPSRERILTLHHKKILRVPTQYMKGLNPQARALAQWPNSFWTALSPSIQEDAEETAKRTVAFLDAERYEPDVGYRPVEGDHPAGPSNYGQDLATTNVSMVPAKIEAIHESEVLVSNPRPNSEYTIIAEVLSDFMRHNQGVAMAFDLLGKKMAERGFNSQRDVGIVKKKYMLMKARNDIGFGWTDATDASASWVWLWDAEKPYRNPSCPTKQWRAFRDSRSRLEPPGLKEGMENVMRGGVRLNSAKKEASKAHWATVARGRERERDLGRDEVSAASVGPSTGRATREPTDDDDDRRHVPDHSRVKGKKRMLDDHGTEEDDWLERRSRDLGREHDRERERRDRERERGPGHIDSDRDRDQSRDRDHDRDRDRDRNRDHDRNWDRSQARDRSHDRDRDRDRNRDHDRNWDRSQARERSHDRDRDWNRDHDRNWDRSQARDRSHDRDRDRDRIRDRSRNERGRYGPREEERNCRRGGNGSDSYPLEKRVRRD